MSGGRVEEGLLPDVLDPVSTDDDDEEVPGYYG